MVSIKTILMLTMFVAGGLAASQAALNAQLSSYLNSPFQASFISFCVGAFALGLLLVGSRQGIPSLESFKQMPPHYLFAGLFGAVFITCAIFLIPRIGVVNVLFLGLAGQMIVSLAIDSYGLFGVKRQQLTMFKVLGLVLIIAGVACLKLNSASITQPKSAQANAKLQGRSDYAGAYVQSNPATDVAFLKSLGATEAPRAISKSLIVRMNRKKSRFDDAYSSYSGNIVLPAKILNRKSVRRSMKADAELSEV